MKHATGNKSLRPRYDRPAFERFCTKIVVLTFVCACFLVIFFCGCQFPYKIDPSGNCLFVKNEDATLPEYSSPFTATQGLRPNEPAGAIPTVPATPSPESQSSIPGISATPGTASGIAPSTSGTGVIDSGTTRGTLLVPGTGPIVLVAPDEQIALIGSEVILFANYKGDDDYLRTGERIEWSLGGVGHIQTTNKTQCSNILSLDFNKDKKLSDRFAVTSTLHYEGTIDRGSIDEQQGKVPHLAGQSWISIQSAEEGTSTVTAFAPTIKDWNRRTSSATVHWIDAEWIYPRPDITKYDEPKIFITQVKKRSSGMPCPNWLVRYEVIGGPNAGLGPDQSKVVEVPTGADGKAAIELYLLEGNSGTSTIKATIIRPAGVDGGTKRLELHSSTVVNYWSPDAPLSMETIRPPQIPWDKQAEWTINVTNRSEVTKFGVVTLQLPGYAKLISSTPQTSSRTAQSDGGELVSWNLELPGTTISQIKFVLQAVTDDPVQRSQELVLELNPQLSMFPRESGEYGQGSTTGPTGPSGSTGNIYGQNPPGGPSTYAPESNIPSFPDSPASTGNLPFNGGDYAGINTGATTPSATQGHSDPTVFANLLQVECKLGTAMTVNRPIGVAVILTNTATVPFSMGQIQVELPDGLGFIQFDNNGAPKYVEENDNLITKQTYSLMDENGNDITVQPGQTLTLPINVAPTRVGTLSMKATVYGQSPNGQWLPIDGATHTGRTTATAQ